MSFYQFLLVVRARWLVVLSVFLAVVFVGLGISLLSPKLYNASASVVIDAKTDPVAGVANPALLMTSYIATQVDIVSSERVSRRVVKLLKLDDIPEYRQKWLKSTHGQGDEVAWIAGTILQKRLTVTPSRESDMIDIAVTWPDAQFAAVLANAFAQSYIDTNIEMKVEPAKQYAQWFDQRSRALRSDLEDKQKKLSDYEKESGIVATDNRVDIEIARLNELSTQLVNIQGQRQDSQSRQSQVSGDIESLPEVLQSPLIGNLKAELSLAEAKMQDIATTLGKNHPDYQMTAAQITSLHRRIADESAKIAASLGSATQVNVRREREVSLALAAQKQRVLDFQGQRDALSVLQGDVQAAQRNLDAVTQRLAQSNLESQAQQTNILLLTPAVAPLLRSSPNIRVNLILAMFLGVLLGLVTALAMELMDKRVRNAEEFSELLGQHLLGKIGRSTSKVVKKEPAARLLPPLEPMST